MFCLTASNSSRHYLLRFFLSGDPHTTANILFESFVLAQRPDISLYYLYGNSFTRINIKQIMPSGYASGLNIVGSALLLTRSPFIF